MGTTSAPFHEDGMGAPRAIALFVALVVSLIIPGKYFRLNVSYFNSLAFKYTLPVPYF